MLAQNPSISTSEFFLPWLTQSTDFTLRMDRTSQVHKSRSSRDLIEEFMLVKESIDYGRSKAIQHYLTNKIKKYGEKSKVVGGPLSPGAPEPLPPDLKLIFNCGYNIKIIQLVRNPLDCFASMKSRYEMDSNPYNIGSLWGSFNKYVREYGLTENSNNQLIVRYEDLKLNTKVELEKICKFINVPFNLNMLPNKDVYFGKNKLTKLNNLISIEEKAIINDLCSKEASYYNYGE